MKFYTAAVNVQHILDSLPSGKKVFDFKKIVSYFQKQIDEKYTALGELMPYERRISLIPDLAIDVAHLYKASTEINFENTSHDIRSIELIEKPDETPVISVTFSFLLMPAGAIAEEMYNKGELKMSLRALYSMLNTDIYDITPIAIDLVRTENPTPDDVDVFQ